MAQAASFTVNDRESTPVGHVFTPKRISTELAEFVETASVPIGEKRVSISTRKSGSNYKVRTKLEVPTLVTEVVNGVNVPKVPRTIFIDTTYTFPDLSSLQERKNAVGMHYNMQAPAQTMIDASLTGLEGIW
jgi:hypothetical protein